MIQLSRVMRMLSNERPVFHSEADFQYALAWQIHKEQPSYSLRLEYPLYPGEPDHLDIWATRGAEALAIELKYKTRSLHGPVGGELFWLKEHSAQDCNRYDFIKDVQRLEQFVFARDSVTGYAILLTNDSSYWGSPLHASTADASFRIHEGRVLTGQLAWGPAASRGTTKGREKVLSIMGSYKLTWRDYYEVKASENVKGYGKFRYLAVKVISEQKSGIGRSIWQTRRR